MRYIREASGSTDKSYYSYKSSGTPGYFLGLPLRFGDRKIFTETLIGI